MSQSHLPVQFSFLFIAVDSRANFEDLHSVEIRACLNHWPKDAKKCVCKGSQLKPKSITASELSKQLEVQCQAFIKAAPMNYADATVDCEIKTSLKANATANGGPIHDVQCRVQLPEASVFDEEARAVQFIAELFAGYAHIELIERVERQEHLNVLTMGKGNIDSIPFF